VALLTEGLVKSGVLWGCMYVCMYVCMYNERIFCMHRKYNDFYDVIFTA
jgi:hypothetical protein